MITPGSLFMLGVIVAMLVGTKKLRTIGEDLGAAVKGFRKGLQGEEIPPNPPFSKGGTASQEGASSNVEL